MDSSTLAASPLSPSSGAPTFDLAGGLADYFATVRQQTLTLCQPLQTADYELQAADFTSPAKWHLAHTSWFFETFLLKPNLKSYQEFHPQFGHLFNSYYNGIGQPYPRAKRGLLSRPSLDEVLQYRHHIDHHMQALLAIESLQPLIELGLNHEQQHQELLLTDLLYCWSVNPMQPVYQALPSPVAKTESPINDWLAFDGGIYRIGHKASNGFAFDNEGPRHDVLLQDFSLAKRLVTNREYLEFINAGGYQQPEFWLSDGWAWVQREGIVAPLYWWSEEQKPEQEWQQFSFNGQRAIELDAPVTHVSFFEADAYARWAGARLATEAEWEVSALQADATQGHFADAGRFSPRPLGTSGITQSNGLQQQFGDCWEWTASPYQPYPGYVPAAGAVGEYNGKFMCNQMVLRGGSCVTPVNHVRSTYRNFFYPHERWQFTGIRLAR